MGETPTHTYREKQIGRVGETERGGMRERERREERI